MSPYFGLFLVTAYFAIGCWLALMYVLLSRPGNRAGRDVLPIIIFWLPMLIVVTCFLPFYLTGALIEAVRRRLEK